MAAARTTRLQPLSAAALVLAILAPAGIVAPAAAQSHEIGHWIGLHHTFNKQRAPRGPEIAGNFRETADGDTSSNPPRPAQQRFADVPPANPFNPPTPPTQRFADVPPSNPYYGDLPKPPSALAGQPQSPMPKTYGYNGAKGAYAIEVTPKPGGNTYANPKSFQIVSPGKRR